MMNDKSLSRGEWYMSDQEQRPVIAFVTPGTFKVPSDYSSSVERVVDEVSRHLAEHASVYVLSKKTAGAASLETVENVTHIRPVAQTTRAYQSAMLVWLQRHAPDLIQVENRPSYVRRIKQVCPHAQIWLSLHSITFLSQKHISKLALRRALTAADRIVVNSRFLKMEVCRRVPGCRGKIVINHLGVDVDRFVSQWEPAERVKREAYKRKLGYADRQIVVYSGRLLPIKGVHHLLSIWPAVVKRYPRAMLLIIGSAYYGSSRRTTYVKRLYRLGRRTPKHVRFMSYCPYSEMPGYLAMADLVVVPSAKKEAFGLVVVEAMAAGASIIASRVGGIKEILQDGVNGRFVKPRRLRTELRHRICELLSDPDKRQRMGRAGARIARDSFTWIHTADRQLEFYRRYAPIFSN